jgi:predicted regulator of Ras-like GTPase activity (Roadblock/LC7/MglB family)
LSTDFLHLLQELRWSLVGLEEAALIDLTGRVVATTQPDVAVAERMAAMSMALLALGDQTAVGLHRGELVEVCVRTGNGTLILLPLPIDAILAALVRLEAPLGLVLLELRRFANALMLEAERAVKSSLSTPATADEADSLLRAAWMIESIACGLLHLYKVIRPPVPIEEMLARPYPTFAARRREDKEEAEGAPLEYRWNLAHVLYFRIYYSEDSVRVVERFGLIGNEAEAEYFAFSLLLPEHWMRLAAGKTSNMRAMARTFRVPQQKIHERLADLGLG